MLDEDKRADLLKDEYIMLQQFYEQIDNKGLTIKNWSITVALAAIGTGILYNKNVLWAGFAAACCSGIWKPIGEACPISSRCASRKSNWHFRMANGRKKPLFKYTQPGRGPIKRKKTKPLGTCSNRPRSSLMWS